MNPPQPSANASNSDIPTPSPSPENGSPNDSPPQPYGSNSTVKPTTQSSSPPSKSTPTTTPTCQTTNPEQPPKPDSLPAQPPKASRIPINQIDPGDPANHRANLDPEKVNQLATSIAAVGLINPITVRPLHVGYRLIAGNHRLQAMQRLNAKYIDATVLNVDDLTADTIALTENITRSNLTPVEEACQLHNLVENHPNGVDGVATIISRSTTWILDRLDILTWPSSLRNHVHDRKISLSAAKRLAKIQPDDVREDRIHHAATHGINTRTAALWLQDAIAAHAPPPPPSEKTSAPPLIEYVTETQTPCWLCQTLTKLEATRPLRICEDCITNIQTQLRTAPEPQQHHHPAP